MKSDNTFKIEKRDGTLVDFYDGKIIQAIMAAMVEVGEMDYDLVKEIARKIKEERTETTVFEIERRIVKELYVEIGRASCRERV